MVRSSRVGIVHEVELLKNKWNQLNFSFTKTAKDVRTLRTKPISTARNSEVVEVWKAVAFSGLRNWGRYACQDFREARSTTPKFRSQHSEKSNLQLSHIHQRCPPCRKKSRTSRTSSRSAAAKTLLVSQRTLYFLLELCLVREFHQVEQMLTMTSYLAARIKKNKKNHTIKFKVRCKRYLYTLVLKDLERAEKLKQSLPPGILEHHVDDESLINMSVSRAANKRRSKEKSKGQAHSISG